VPDAADRGHEPGDAAAQPRMPAPGERAVVGQRFRKPHRDAGADGGREADEKRLQSVRGRERGGKQRRQRRHRAVHQPGEARLHDLQHEHAPLHLGFGSARVPGQVLLAELVRQALVSRFGCREIAQELAHARVGRALLCALVELPRLIFALLGLVAHLVEAERPYHPDRLVLHEAAHVLAADERDVLAEALPIELDQPAAMLVLLLRQLGEDLGGGRVCAAP
jgi:hypothetical protein